MSQRPLPYSLERPVEGKRRSRRCPPEDRGKEADDYVDPETYVRNQFPQERFPPMLSRLELVVSVDSSNRDRSLYPDPGCCKLPCNAMAGVKRITQLSLVTLEVPKSQWTVEEDANTIYFDEGVSIPDDETNANHTLAVTTADGSTLYASVFRQTNPIVSVQGPFGAGPYTYRITTAYPHLMDLLPYYSGGTIEMIGLAGLTTIGDRELNASNVTVVDDFNFDVTLTTNTLVAGASSSPPLGYVYVPPPRSPAILARLLEGAFATQIDTDTYPEFANVTVDFDRRRGRFVICAVLERDEALTIETFADASLASYLGFACNQRLLPSNVERNCLARNRQQGNACAEAAQRPSWLMGLRVPPGLYGPQGLRDQLDFEANRLNFEGCCDDLANNMARFVFSNACGVCQTIQIPYGRWTPDQLAYFLQTSMNSIVGASVYAVDYAPDCGGAGGRFVFRSTDGSKFGLEFSASCASPALPTPGSSLDVPERLGFGQCNYRGSSYYASDQPVSVPGFASTTAASCCVDRWATYNWCVSHNGSDKSFSLSLNEPAGVSYTVSAVDLANNTVTLVPTDPNHVANYQTGQVLNFYPSGVVPASQVYTGVVLYALNPADPSLNYVPGSVTIDAGTLAADMTVGSTFCVSSTPGDEPTFNLYLLDRQYLACAIDAGVLGFDRIAYLFGNYDPKTSSSNLPTAVADAYAGVPSYALPRLATSKDRPSCGNGFAANVLPPYKSSFAYDFAGPRYLLVGLKTPEGGSIISSHMGPNGIQTPVLAKVLIYPDVRVERIYPMHVSFSSPSDVANIELRFHNPDLTPYRFHGLDWSATFVLSVS